MVNTSANRLAVLRQRLRQDGNVRDIDVTTLGAVGDGKHDDTKAFNAAANIVGDLPTGARIMVPPGTYLIRPGGATHVAVFIPGTNFELVGAGSGRSIIKLANGVGDYKAMFATASPSTSTSGLTFRNVTLDGNSANNVISNKAPLFAGLERYAIRHFSGQRVLIENCRFTNMDNVNTLSLNSSNASDIVVRNCLFDNVGADSVYHDHSSIYIAATRMEISGCTFLGGGVSATTAIETHGSSQHVHHNKVDSYYTGANVTGVAVSSVGVVVDHNILTHVAIGIELWSYPYTGNNSGWGMEHVRIASNTITVDYDEWGAGPNGSTAPFTSQKCGVGIDDLSSLPVNDLQIVDNTITFQTFSGTPVAADNLDAGIRLRRSATTSFTGVDQDIVIARNTITSPVSAGLYMNLLGTQKRVNIDSNRIINVAQNNAAAFSNAFKVGMQLVGAFTDCRIRGNVVTDDRATAVMTAGVDVQFVTSATNCEISDNTVRWTDTVGAGSELIVATASAAAFYIRHRAQKYTALTRPTLGGSQVVDTPNGVTYIQTSAPYGTSWAATVAVPAAATTLPKSGFYSSAPGPHSTITPVLNTAYYSPLWVGTSGTVTRVGAEVTTLQATSVLRLGIYADAGDGRPGSLLLDAGTIDGSSATAQEITLGTPLALAPGCYWLCAVAQVAAGTMVVRSLSGGQYPVGAGSLALATGTATFNGYTQTGVTGALGTFAFTSNTGVAPLVVVRWQ